MQCKSINVFFVYHCGNRCFVTHIFVFFWGGAYIPGFLVQVHMQDEEAYTHASTVLQ